MKALRICLYQPTTHFRMPFTYQRRHTYPLPPYSTVVGMLCNLMGIFEQKNEKFIKLQNCLIAVSGHFELKHTEYIWFRNLSSKAHEGVYASVNNRIRNGEVGHVGGQSPMRIDVLENFRCNIHLAQKDGRTDFLESVVNEFMNPINRLEPLHLGRSEDWFVPQSIRFTELITSNRDKNFGHFFWIPENTYNSPEGFDFNKVEGLYYNLTIGAHIVDYDKYYNRHAARQFDYVRVKLNDGKITGQSYLCDRNVVSDDRVISLPVFFASIKNNNNDNN